MKNKTTKIIFTSLIILSTLIIGYTTLAAQKGQYGKNLSIEQKKKVIDKRVEEGKIETKQAQEIKEKLQNCNSENPQKLGQKYNLHFGQEYNKENNQKGRKQNNNEGNKQNNAQGQKLKNCECLNSTEVTQ